MIATFLHTIRIAFKPRTLLMSWSGKSQARFTRERHQATPLEFERRVLGWFADHAGSRAADQTLYKPAIKYMFKEGENGKK